MSRQLSPIVEEHVRNRRHERVYANDNYWPRGEEGEKQIDRAIEFFEPRYGRKLSRHEGAEIVHNLLGFVSVLSKWHREDLERKAAKADSGGPAEPEAEGS